MGKRSKPVRPSTPVASIRHKDKRANIPTEELRDFVADDEAAPKMMLYPRDPSLDPQLVWKGKDEQDAADLAVPVVPIYIQEKIHPQALIENLRDTAGGGQDEPEVQLFLDFNGLEQDFARKVDFYSHDSGSQPHWSNRMILGDSLLVMTSLAEKEGLKGKVQTIYFDPPYGIKFGSNWQVSTRKRDVKDGKVEDATRQPEQIRAFRDTWRLGIHSYLAYLRDRLVAARELLTETGSIFVQIGDENVHLVRCALDEVFGSENFVSLITVRKTGGTTGKFLPATADYILWFARDTDRTKYREAYRLKQDDGGDATYDMIELTDGRRRRMSEEERQTNPDELHGKRFQFTILTSPRIREARTGYFAISFDGKEYLPTAGEWKTNRDGITRLISAKRVDRVGNTLRYVRFLEDFPATALTNTWNDVGGATEPQYVVQTNAEIIKRCMMMTTDPGDLVLDPTCGSGTTAFVAEQWGRRWITCDTSRVALALARTRLMAAKYPYYLLADSPEGEDKEYELTGRRPPPHPLGHDIKKGFVYSRVPHVTLKSIANNPDIREGMSRAEIDAAIAKHAETETLYDKPYEDKKRVRVTGPFTVESLSPHRVLATDEVAAGVRAGYSPGRSGRGLEEGPDFVSMILDNLRKAGVQNTVKKERLVFETLEPFAGSWVHAVGTYAESDGKPRRVAVSIGPEHGTVGPQQVKEAAKEAVQGVGFDMLIICGFAFDPHVSEEAKRYGKLTVLAARMNPDLAMGDELLKKTGAGNLFMVFGEPDVEIRSVRSEPRLPAVAGPSERVDAKKGGKNARAATKGGAKPGKAETAEAAANGEQLVVEIKGVDVYDPTTGAIRSSSTDDIACWFIDTNYNGESFFVRHAYFTGSAKDDDGPYDKLKRALRAEIDETAWSSLYSTTSRPFDKPETGKLAVKVINHYGDEVLKVFEV